MTSTFFFNKPHFQLSLLTKQKKEKNFFERFNMYA